MKQKPSHPDIGVLEQAMRKAIALSLKGMRSGHGGPFGAVVLRAGKVVGGGHNEVLSRNDPTAHAEIVALRDAGARLNTFDLSGCVLVTSCEPCPMCLAAAYWARVDAIVFGNSRKDAATAGFADDFLYAEFAAKPRDRKLKSSRLLAREARLAFQEWRARDGKIHYGPDVEPPLRKSRPRATKPS